MVKVLPADSGEWTLKNFELIAEEKDGGSNNDRYEDVGVLLHNRLDGEHVICLASVHLAHTFRARVLKLRVDESESEMQVDPCEAQAHQDLVEVIGVGGIPIGVLLYVPEVLKARVRC